MDSNAGVAVKGELSIDTRPIEEVHADLIRKRNQLAAQIEVVAQARMFVGMSTGITAEAKAELLAILNRGVR